MPLGGHLLHLFTNVPVQVLEFAHCMMRFGLSVLVSAYTTCLLCNKCAWHVSIHVAVLLSSVELHEHRNRECSRRFIAGALLHVC